MLFDSLASAELPGRAGARTLETMSSLVNTPSPTLELAALVFSAFTSLSDLP